MEKNRNLSIELKEKKPRRSYRKTQHSVLEKCQAVLSIWSERRSASQVCRELGITWNHLSQWQDRALDIIGTLLSC